MIAKSNTFLIAGVISKLKGTFYLKDIGGLLKEKPFVAILYIIPAFALAGIPPLSGFFAKFILIKAGIEDEHYIISGVAILTSLLTLFSMIKIWNQAFLKKQPDNSLKPTNYKLTLSDMFPSIVLALASILIGVFAGQFFEVTMSAARQIMDPNIYIEAVLNKLK